MLLHLLRPKVLFISEDCECILYSTFQSTCKELGFLENDRHWDQTLEKAAVWLSLQTERAVYSDVAVLSNFQSSESLGEIQRQAIRRYHAAGKEGIATQCPAHDWQGFQQMPSADWVFSVGFRRPGLATVQFGLANIGRTFREQGLSEGIQLWLVVTQWFWITRVHWWMNSSPSITSVE